MENKVITSIYIDGSQITHYSAFTLMQRFNEHHSFELRFNYDQVETFGSLSLDKSKDFVGKNITVEFGNLSGQEQIFTGKITRVEFAHTNGYHGELIVSGHSPSILLERGPDVGSYLAKNLQSIVQQATSDAPANDLTMQIKPVSSATLDYIIQYKESDFAFLNRLSAEYHEWFFYDGQTLNFGKPDKLKEVSLIYGRNLQTIQYAMQVAPLKYTKFAYNSKHDELLTSAPAGTSGSSPDISHAIEASNQVFSKNYNQPLAVRVNSKEEIDTIVNNEQKATISDLVQISGSSDEPQVALGTVLNISTSLKGLTDFEQHDFGKFLVTSVFHQVDEVGHYRNSFEGVAADTERLPVKVATKPLADMQLATVLDNNDPDGLSRIKVQFKWQCSVNDPTEWLRIVTPTAGNDDQGQNNRGFLAIPEIDDQVLVGFEEGNIARPVVIGSVYHSANGDSRTQVNNHLKSIATRSGHLITFDDSEASQGITITDRNTNIIHIDTASNNITITALENMTLNCKNMQINVQENMDIQVGKDQSTSVGNSQSTSVSKDIATTAGNNYSLSASGDIQENSDSRKEFVSKDFVRQSETSNELASEIVMFSQKENMTLQSGKTVEVNSAEKSKMF
ncbi:phage baseplate assembly protein V [Mucilaginibacter sp. CAU 1740]|uniref:type VI secretion system Vgr family protein n=1 Tax=Mucilaginibacter sp. CAU 1740 TaxID=3140365 RepID=UPI00325BE17D